MNWRRGEATTKPDCGPHELARTNDRERRFYKIEGGYFWHAKELAH